MFNFVKRLLHRDEPEGLLRQARDLQHLMNHDQALEMLDKVVEAVPEMRLAALLEKATTLAEMGRVDEALEWVHQVMAQAPDDDDARLRRSMFLLAKQVGRAYEKCDEWITFAPADHGFTLRYPVRMQRKALQAPHEIALFRDSSVDHLELLLAQAGKDNGDPSGNEVRGRPKVLKIAGRDVTVIEAFDLETRCARLTARVSSGGAWLLITTRARLPFYRSGVATAFEKLFTTFKPAH